MAKFGFARKPPPIVLLTDFGFRDYYVGVMKGVICGIASGAQIIDLSHNVMPQDVAEVMCFLASDRAGYVTGEVVKIDGGMAM